jgi:hypothetical protein
MQPSLDNPDVLLGDSVIDKLKSQLIITGGTSLKKVTEEKHL